MNMQQADSGNNNQAATNGTHQEGFSLLKVPPRPADPLFGVNQLFRQDTDPSAVNGSVGVYQNEQGYTAPFEIVRQVEQEIAAERAKETIAESNEAKYLPIEGLESFCKASQELLFGEQSAAVHQDRIATAQTPGGTGALYLGARTLMYLKQEGHLPELSGKVYLSNPTWANHKNIFSGAGFDIESYPYYNSQDHSVDFQAMLQGIQQAPEGSVILLHACCHNPTGVDLTEDQWKALLPVIRDKNLIPFIDCAYQGFANDLQSDVQGVRLFAESGIPVLVSHSLSKIMGMYNRRTGSLSIIGETAEAAANVLSHMQGMIRQTWSNPPKDGADIASRILNDPVKRKEWKEELASMQTRITTTREHLYTLLDAHGIADDFAHIKSGNGMFSMTGLSSQQVAELQQQHHVYMPGSGRLCLATLNPANIDHVADAIAAVK